MQTSTCCRWGPPSIELAKVYNPEYMDIKPLNGFRFHHPLYQCIQRSTTQHVLQLLLHDGQYYEQPTVLLPHLRKETCHNRAHARRCASSCVVKEFFRMAGFNYPAFGVQE
ncbi:hypothetical protein PAXRUDRAFT_310006 [Paxillus rubicundulus Ve08.2h10]|uniref:Unplaced genomic scaffold scaffold_1659, whole genome shotgun sequence n=1 Tax=Paxillus rubicundulus Ve08.2h10 TaxID=930991 RepID=A0A0D0CTM6_9AGAM|nr:hypothetical protein PAXRUDRAFT_310006 [Paxillus rubicundulus Ve08.2h10]